MSATMKMAEADWNRLDDEYKTTKADGSRWVLINDATTGATVLQQVEIDYGEIFAARSMGADLVGTPEATKSGGRRWLVSYVGIPRTPTTYKIWRTQSGKWTCGEYFLADSPQAAIELLAAHLDRFAVDSDQTPA